MNSTHSSNTIANQERTTTIVKRKRFSTHWRSGLLSIGLTLILLTSLLPAGHAYADNWTTAVNGIEAVYDGVASLESVIQLENQQTQTLRKQNNSRLQIVNARIKDIDKAKLAALKTAVTQIEQKYAPLFSEYGELGKQAAAARKQKNTKKVEVISLKRNKMKAEVTAARTEIKQKKAALTQARKETAARKKTVKEALAPVQTVKKQITAENKIISTYKKSRSAARKSYHAAVKRGDAISAAAYLTVVYNKLGAIHASQQKMYNWEQQITTIIKTAESRL
ncbi:hypothetical protein [Paenibacillus shenyangensis]|uniref:hypothetical protein n=1 Tax=Paenibacillus sp. A9 TaxID=1284352 RepID=UPI000370D664|nr:hypothetical protein [Paenibacillus sp. A9]